MLPAIYAERGIRVSPETVYLNHILSFVKSGHMAGLSNAKLRELGGRLEFCEGLPDFFDELRKVVSEDSRFEKLDISLEHYIVSTGLAEMIRGSAISGHVDGTYGISGSFSGTYDIMLGGSTVHLAFQAVDENSSTLIVTGFPGNYVGTVVLTYGEVSFVFIIVPNTIGSGATEVTPA